MKMKSAVLASALVAVSSVFATSLYDSEVIYTNWFNQVESSAVEIESIAPVLLNGDAITSNQDGYAVTAQVTVVIHATVPTAAPTNITVNSSPVSPKGSICAAYDGNTAKWYGLKYENSAYAWTELAKEGDEPFSTPDNNTEYTLVTEFDDITDGANRVRYWVGNQCSKWYTSGHNNALKMVGLDGSGSYTKVVGLLVNAWTGTGIEDVPIAISKATLVAMGVDTANTTPDAIKAILNTTQDNGIAAWANYALGISDNINNTVAAAKKPFAAPVQNSNDSTLTFKLGGVNARTDVADVKYAIEALDAPDGSYSGALTYQDATATTDITLDSSGVKYYRVKVQIDAKGN